MHKQYFVHKPRYFKKSPLANKMSESKYQVFPWRFGGEGNPEWLTNHSWQCVHLQMPRSTLMLQLPWRNPASLCSSLVGGKRTPKTQLWQTDSSPCPTHCLFLQALQQLGLLQGSPLIPSFPIPCCRMAPLEERINSDLLPTCSIDMSSKLAPLPLSGRRWYCILSFNTKCFKMAIRTGWSELQSFSPKPRYWFWNGAFSQAVKGILKVFQLFFIIIIIF